MPNFLFDNQFDVDRNGHLKPDEKPEAVYTEEDLAAARGEAQRIGIAAGKQEALSSIENLAANTLQNIAAAVDNIGAQHEQAILAVKQEAAQMAMVIAGKLAPALLQRQPLDEIKSLIMECLEMVPNEPRIVVRVNETLLDLLADDVNQLSAGGAFQGKVVLLGEPQMTDANCRVEWADGGAERNMDVLFQKIESAVGRYCANISDQINQIEQTIQAGEAMAGQQDGDQDMAASDQLNENLVIAPQHVDEDPFPLPPGAEDFGIVENPLPPLARTANQFPPTHDVAEGATSPINATEP